MHKYFQVGEYESATVLFSFGRLKRLSKPLSTFPFEFWFAFSILRRRCLPANANRHYSTHEFHISTCASRIVQVTASLLSTKTPSVYSFHLEFASPTHKKRSQKRKGLNWLRLASFCSGLNHFPLRLCLFPIREFLRRFFGKMTTFPLAK